MAGLTLPGHLVLRIELRLEEQLALRLPALDVAVCRGRSFQRVFGCFTDLEPSSMDCIDNRSASRLQLIRIFNESED